MHLMTTIMENVSVMVLTIVALVGGFYMLLWLLNVWLKIKSGSREEEGLSNLWESAVTEAKQKKHKKE